MNSLINTLYYSNSEPVAERALEGGTLAAVIIIVGFLVLIALVMLVLGIIGRWKMFDKAGQAGWAAIIPFYSLYTLCTTVGVSAWWMVVLYGSAFLSLLILSESILALFGLLFYIFCLIVRFYFTIILAAKTADSYGKDSRWAIGLYVPSISVFFTLALGIGESKYVGPSRMSDPIMDKFAPINYPEEEKVDSKKKATTKGSKFCSECGSKMAAKDKFCPECGAKK